MTDGELVDLWVGAFRYYLGRMTISTHAFMRSLVDHWGELPERVHVVIRRELDEALGGDPERLGMAVDRIGWQNTWLLLTKDEPKRFRA